MKVSSQLIRSLSHIFSYVHMLLFIPLVQLLIKTKIFLFPMQYSNIFCSQKVLSTRVRHSLNKYVKMEEHRKRQKDMGTFLELWQNKKMKYI